MDQPDTDRRAFLIGAVGMLPVIGGLAELAMKAASRPARIEATKVGARQLLEPDADRGLPFDKVADFGAEAAAERRREERERSRSR